VNLLWRKKVTWLTPKLKHRIQIKQAVDTPVEEDAFGDVALERSYRILTTIWAAIKEETDFHRSFTKVERGNTNLDEGESHEFTVRRAAVMELGKAFASGFSGGFDSIADLKPLKSDYFIFLFGNSTSRGRLFRISRIKVDENNREYFKIKTIEIEEQGTGAPA
jgi:hypothetical protein